jgi:hypothetical protein
MPNDLPGHDIRGSLRRVDLEVIRTELVDSITLNMLSAFTNPSIAALALAAVDLAERAVHAYQEDVERQQELPQFHSPFREFDHVVYDQIVARQGKRNYASVKASKEPRSHVPRPGKRPFGIATFWQSGS